MTDVTSFAMRGIVGIDRQSIGDILAYMNSIGCTACGLFALLCAIKRDRTWDLVFLHPENQSCMNLDVCYNAAALFRFLMGGRFC